MERRWNLWVQIALALSAASALIYEVVVTDVLFFYFIESSYSIATVLSVFLFGLGSGSLLVYFFSSKIKDKKILFGSLQIFISLYAFFVLIHITEIVDQISVFGTFLTSFALLLVPTMFLGAIFPLATSMFKKKNKDIVGLVYSSDLFGAIVGSLIAGFFLIPLYGDQITLVFGGFLNLVSAIFIFPKKYKFITFLLGIFILMLISIGGILGNNINQYDFYANSPYGVVKVIDGGLFINERGQCIWGGEGIYEGALMADYALSALEKKEDLKLLNIGLGCGLTLKRALNYNPKIDIVEINERVVEANEMMGDVLEDERINLLVEDGLKYLRETDKKYDSILIDLESPLVAHSSNLYTVEAFELVDGALNEGGVFGLFNYEMNSIGNHKRYMDILYYSLKESFDYVYEYPGIFLATDKKLEGLGGYVPETSYEINTIDRNTLEKLSR